MTSQHSDKSSSNSLPYELGSLPPRSEKHGRKKANKTTDELYLQENNIDNKEEQPFEQEIGNIGYHEIRSSDTEEQFAKMEKQYLENQIDSFQQQNQGQELYAEADTEGIDEEDEYVTKRSKTGFPLIQIILFSFLSVIAGIIVIWGWNFYQDSKADNAFVDPLDGLFREPEDEQQVPPPIVPSEEENQNEGSTNEDNDPVTDPEDVEDPQAGLEEPEQPVDSDESNQEEVPNMDNNQEPNEADVEGPAIITVHTVQPGETFYSITMKYYESSQYRDYLAEFNQIEDQASIFAGMQINIPAKP